MSARKSTRNGIAREDVLIVLLIVLIVAIPIGYLVSRQWQHTIKTHEANKEQLKRVMAGAFAPPSADQWAIAREKRPREMKNMGRTVILHDVSGTLEIATFLLPEVNRANSVESVQTICWVSHRDSREWQGARGFDVLFQDRQSGGIWRLDSYEGTSSVAADSIRSLDPIDRQEYWTSDLALAEIVKQGDRG